MTGRSLACNSRSDHNRVNRLPVTPATLVSGADAARREAAIIARLAMLAPGTRIALIVEGPPGPADALADVATATNIDFARIAPGCPCCIGNLTLRVTLNRMLRRQPAHLFIGLASSAHVSQLREFLRAPPYHQHLQLTDDLVLIPH